MNVLDAIDRVISIWKIYIYIYLILIKVISSGINYFSPFLGQKANFSTKKNVSFEVV